MLTFSFFSAHPHNLIFVSRCSTMLSLITRGNFTWQNEILNAIVKNVINGT
jgi:hypothetical protein